MAQHRDSAIAPRNADDLALSGNSARERAARFWQSFWGSHRFGRHLGMAALIAILAFLTLYPSGMLLYGSLHSTPPGTAGEFNLDGYRAMLSAENFKILLNS